MSPDYDPDENDVRGEQSISKTSRRGALAALGLGGLAMLGSGSAAGNIAGGPDSDEIAHLARPVYEGPESDLPDPGVAGRRYTVTDEGGVYPQWTELRDSGDGWDAINFGVGSLDADSVSTEDLESESVDVDGGGTNTFRSETNFEEDVDFKKGLSIGEVCAVLRADETIDLPDDELTAIEWDDIRRLDEDIISFEEDDSEVEFLADGVFLIEASVRWDDGPDWSEGDQLIAEIDVSDGLTGYRDEIPAPGGLTENRLTQSFTFVTWFETEGESFEINARQRSGETQSLAMNRERSQLRVVKLG